MSWARQFVLCLVLVQPRKTENPPDMTEKLFIYFKNYPDLTEKLFIYFKIILT